MTTGSPLATQRWLSGKGRSGRPTRIMARSAAARSGGAAGRHRDVRRRGRVSSDRATRRSSCTADFITPPADDPHLYGQIAAANSLSRRLRDGRAAARGAGAVHVPEGARARSGARDPRRRAGQGGRGGRGRHRRPHRARGGALLRAVGDGRRRSAADHRATSARVPATRSCSPSRSARGSIINGMRKDAIDEAERAPMLETLARAQSRAAEAVTAMLPRVHAITDVTGFGLRRPRARHGGRLAGGAAVELGVAAALSARARDGGKGRDHRLDAAQSRERGAASARRASIHSGTRSFTIRRPRAGCSSPSRRAPPTSCVAAARRRRRACDASSARCSRHFQINRSSKSVAKVIDDGARVP